MLGDVVQPTAHDRLTIIPATVDLSSADIELLSNEKRSFLLHDALRQADMTRLALDYILIDCPPSLNLLTVNAMVAAHSVLIPLQGEFFALEGLSQLMLTIREVRQSANPSAADRGVLMTMVDSRNNLSAQVEADARENLGDLVFQTRIPRNVRVSEAPSYALPVLTYDTASKGRRPIARSREKSSKNTRAWPRSEGERAMSTRKTQGRGLGRGLSALMADVREEDESGEERRPLPDTLVPVERVHPNPDQPRRHFDAEALDDLARSISEKGIIQPLIVRESPRKQGDYEIVAGERRWRAAQMAKLHEIPVLLRSFTDTEVLEVAIIENIQRADLNPVEEASGYHQLMMKFGHTQEKLADVLGKSRSHIANAVRL